VYTFQSIEDSAKIYFQNGLNASEGAKLNHIGLGQMDLDKSDVTSTSKVCFGYQRP
jgi:hypothetical protein